MSDFSLCSVQALETTSLFSFKSLEHIKYGAKITQTIIPFFGLSVTESAGATLDYSTALKSGLGRSSVGVSVTVMDSLATT